VGAWGDNLQNDVTAGGSDTITAGGSTTITYRLVANSAEGDIGGCNVDATHAATLTITVPANVTASPSSVSFTDCGTAGQKSVTFSSNTAGDYSITHSISGGKSGSVYKNQANFTLHVQAPAAQNTAPKLTVPAGIQQEGNAQGGATVAYSGISATDAENGSLNDAVQCSPASGSFFPLGSTRVDCSVTDSGGLSDTGFFFVTVVDTTAPTLSNVPADRTVEGNTTGGANVSYASPTASDVVEASPTATCSPASGFFALGSHTVACACTAKDASGNTSSASFKITVQDTTAPTLTNVPADKTVEGNTTGGANVSYTKPTASDIVDASPTVTCSPAPGSFFALGGPHTVTCTAKDASGNASQASFDVTVVDTTAPTLNNVPAEKTVEGNTTGGANVSYTSPTASDIVDASPSVSCSPASGFVALRSHTVACTAKDASGNTSQASFKITVVDTTAPTLSNVPADISKLATSAAGAVATYTNPTASDIVDANPSVSCSPASGSTFAPGVTTVTCTAKDASGNTSQKSFKVTVTFNFVGFLPPIDNNKALNAMKAGSTAPLKWQVPDGSGGYISDLSIVSRTQSGVISCTSSSGTVDDLEEYATGGTSLRYDSTSNQFIYNWLSPKKPGTCYYVRITLTDGIIHEALFQLK
jgi:hypothetical protein